MRALKINFGGANNVSLDWNAEVDGLEAVAQKSAVGVMTQLGSDTFIPTRGTGVSATLFSYGVFDLLGMQHTLNFGGLKARRDVQSFEPKELPAVDRVKAIRMSLIDVKDNIAKVSVSVTNQADQSTREILEIE